MSFCSVTHVMCHKRAETQPAVWVCSPVSSVEHPDQLPKHSRVVLGVCEVWWMWSCWSSGNITMLKCSFFIIGGGDQPTLPRHRGLFHTDHLLNKKTACCWQHRDSQVSSKHKKPPGLVLKVKVFLLGNLGTEFIQLVRLVSGGKCTGAPRLHKGSPQQLLLNQHLSVSVFIYAGQQLCGIWGLLLQQSRYVFPTGPLLPLPVRGFCSQWAKHWLGAFPNLPPSPRSAVYIPAVAVLSCQWACPCFGGSCHQHLACLCFFSFSFIHLVSDLIRN